MYDRESRFRMEDTMNAARIEYTEKAVMHMAARRCDVIRISQTEAVLALITKYNLPNQFYLDIPTPASARSAASCCASTPTTPSTSASCAC